MRAHPLPEARSYADLMLTELRKVIPSFLKRVDLPDRGVARQRVPGRHPHAPWRSWRPGCSPTRQPAATRRRAFDLVDFDPDAEVKLVAVDALPLHRTCPRPRSTTGCGR